MTSLWSKTRAAVNTGYGAVSGGMSGVNFGRIGMPNPFYKPLPLGSGGYELDIHPEYLEKAPYSQDPPPRNRVPRGSGVVKGSAEAKAKMAYLRSLRGKGCSRKKMKGGKSYTGAALRGGDMSWVQPLIESLGGTAMNAIKKVALETGASLTELFANPTQLISKLMEFAPKVASTVKKLLGLFGKSTSSTESSSYTPAPAPAPAPEPSSSIVSRKKEYLRMLKEYDPELYEQKRQQVLRRQSQTTGMEEKQIRSSSKKIRRKKYNKGRKIFDE